MIFISYRRKDTEDFVVRLQGLLEEVFGKDLIFRDVGRLEGSQDWQVTLEEKLEQSEVVLVVIGDRWELAREEQIGHRHQGALRLSLPYDAVRRELELSLPKSGDKPGQKKVIPLLINGTKMLTKDRLAGLVDSSEHPDLEKIPLTKLADKGAFDLTTNGLEHQILELFESLGKCSAVYRKKVEAWKQAKSRGSDGTQGGGPGTGAGNVELALMERYHAKLVDETKDLNLAGIGMKRRLKLPITEAYFSLRAQPCPERETKEERTTNLPFTSRAPDLRIEDLFLAAQRFRGVVLLGEPGAGKSTAVRRFAWLVATEAPHAGANEPYQVPRGIRPVLMRLRDLHLADFDSSVPQAGFLAAQQAVTQLILKEIAPSAFAENVPRQVSDPLFGRSWGPVPILWIFDGLDEVFNAAHRGWVRAAIEQLLQRSPGTERAGDRFLITSRIQGYRDSGVRFGEDFFEVQIASLEFKESCQFIRTWFPSAEREFSHGANVEQEVAAARQRGEDLIERLQERRQHDEAQERKTGRRIVSGLLEMIRNPLLLNIVCVVYDEKRDLPANRRGLYEEALRLMLLRRQEQNPPCTEDSAISVLAEVAWWLQQQGDGVVGSMSEMAKIATARLARLTEGAVERDGERFLSYMHRPIGLLVRGGSLQQEIGFLHRTFQEYLAAVAVNNRERVGTLAQLAGDNRWKEVVALAVRGPDGFVVDLFVQLLEQGLHLQDPWLVGYYLAESKTLPIDAFETFFERCLNDWPGSVDRLTGALQLLDDHGQSIVSLIPALENLMRKNHPALSRVASRLLAGCKAVSPAQTAAPLPPSPSITRRSLAVPQGQRGARFEDPATRLSLIWIEPGSFTMGSSKGDSDERPQHRVTLTEGFWLGEFPVTNEQYALFLREGEAREPTVVLPAQVVVLPARDGEAREPTQWKNNRANQPQQPVVGVTWFDAMAYCAWVTQKIGALCRLPSEAQWEFACRAGSQTEYCFDDASWQLEEYAWFDKNSGGSTQPVGRKKSNAWGLFDMHGNVWEWCYDVFDASIYGTRKDGAVDPVNAPPDTTFKASALRGLRGGSWFNSAAFCRSAVRAGGRAVLADRYGGFRVAVLPGLEMKTKRTQ